MFSNITNRPQLIFDSKTEKQTKGSITQFPKGNYYAKCINFEKVTVYDMDDKVIWTESGIDANVVPVSHNQFVYDSSDRSIRELITLNQYEILSTPCDEIRRIFEGVYVRRCYSNVGQTSFLALTFNNGNKLELNDCTVFNTFNLSANVLSFFQVYTQKLWIYDVTKDDLVYVTSFPRIRECLGFEYYPEAYAITLQTWEAYEVWDSRFPREAIYSVRYSSESNVETVSSITFSYTDKYISYMHYLYPEVKYQLRIPSTQVCYNGIENSLDCYSFSHRYRYKIY